MRVSIKNKYPKHIPSGLFPITGIFFLVVSIFLLWFEKTQIIFPETDCAALLSISKQHVTSISQTRESKTQGNPIQDDGLWDGPILYHEDNGTSIYLLLVEKDLQELTLYRYDGQYHKEMTYRCVTGKQSGDKQIENDDKTPEGIYFNNKTFRDKKVTIFGDRAFGLNYPDVFDDLDGSSGSGIFLHGSNRDITPYSTNGCLVMDNNDLADLDKRVPFKTTPIIIGNRLPYRFSSSEKNLTRVVPFIKKTMLPKIYAKQDASYPRFTLIGYQDQIVAVGIVQVGAQNGIGGISKVYLANPIDDFLVLLKREWDEEKKLVSNLKENKSLSQTSEKTHIESLVESWRSAWEGKNLDGYISHYHPEFINKGRNLPEWQSYKKDLNQVYKKISVVVSDVRIKIDGKKAFAFFKQRYTTESYNATGYKQLEFRRNNNKWKIFREQYFTNQPSYWPK